MVGRRLLRVRPSQDVCIFCAYSLGARSLGASLQTPSRSLWSHSRNAQEIETGQAPKWEAGSHPIDTALGLTQSERTERDRIVQLRTQRQPQQLQRTQARPAISYHFQSNSRQRNNSNSQGQGNGNAQRGASQRQRRGRVGRTYQADGGTSAGNNQRDSVVRGVNVAQTVHATEENAPDMTVRSVPTFNVAPPLKSAMPSPPPKAWGSPSASSKTTTNSWNLSEEFAVKEPEAEPGFGDKGSSEYTTLEYNLSRDKQNQSAQDVNASTWRHLPTRGGAKASVADNGASTELQDSDTVTDPMNDEWIDRAFERHRRERVVPGRHGTLLTTKVISPTPKIRNETRKCARCGEVGHIARDCVAHMRCHVCGELGHLAAACPQHSNRKEGKGAKEASSRFANQRVEDSKVIERRSRRARISLDEEDTSNDKRLARGLRFEDTDRKRNKPRRRESDDEFDDEYDDAEATREAKNAEKAARQAKKREEKASAKASRKLERRADATPVSLSSFMSVSQLAQALGIKYESFVTSLDRLGYDDVFPGMILNSEISGMIAMEYNFDPVFEDGEQEAENRDLQAQPKIDDTEFLPTRPPVVTIMGHVDHGKTTILDYLRKSSIVAGEAGGITQHIGAFSVPLASSGKTITFLDTPGHAAFLAMRQRGANVTDIVVLVVAADDSVKPQTLEAIKHAKAAGVPMIVAVNKIDKEEADLQRVKQDLARHGIDIEDFGGETQVVPVSGKTGQGMDELEENIVTLSEILDHRAPTDGVVEGWVLEAQTKKSGRVATVLVRRGTLKTGTILVAGKTWTRVRTLRDESGRPVVNVGPGMPVEVDGWRDQPIAGDEVLEAPSEQKASDVVDYRIEVAERARAAADMDAINNLRRSEQDKKADTADTNTGTGQTLGNPSGGHISVPFIIKADVSGSAEALSSYILSISNPMISPNILDSSVGQIFESDIDLAATAGGCIISFNLPLDERIKALADAKQVKIIENKIIYRVLEEVKTVLEDKLPAIVTQRVLGEAEISAMFDIGIGGRKKLKIAGCKVRNGVIGRGARVRVLRKDEKIYDGTLSSLKNVKKDVQEMRKGTECGMSFESWENFEVGDFVQTYDELSERRTL